MTTHYYYDGHRVLAQTDGSETLERNFAFGNYIDEVLIMIDEDDHYYSHDHLVSPVALIDDAGAVKATMVLYLAFELTVLIYSS